MQLINNFTIEDVAKFWDSVADEYDDINKSIGGSHYQRFIEGIKYLDIKDGDAVMNIWSRTGNAIPYLKKMADVKISNLEVSERMRQRAREKFPYEEFLTTNLASLPFPDNHFDAILSLETLEHTPKPQELLNEYFRVLKPGKRLVMSLPPRTAEIPLKAYELFFKNHGEGPHNFLSSKTVKKMITDSGLKLICHRGTLLIPAGPEPLQKLGELIINLFKKTFISEFGIRQFYICKK